MNKAIRAAISITILATGIGTLVYLKNSKPEAKKSSITNSATPVEISPVSKVSSVVVVKARGTVMPARSVTLGAEVGGKVIAVSEALQPGGRFVKGDIIARIDPSDYRIAVEQQFEAVNSAAAQVEVEASMAAVAKREWEMFGNESKGNKDAVLRAPQMRSVKTRLKSARSGLRKAKLGVGRTIVRAPFDGMVQTRGIDLGQFVGPGTPLLSFIGTEKYWVQVSIPVERLVWLTIPDVGGETTGSLVTVNHHVGNELIQKQGRIVRLLAGVDPAGHMARVLIEVDDPLGTAALAQKNASPSLVSPEIPKRETSRLPLLLGSYVEVEIQGRRAENVVELKRSSLRDGKLVYLLRDDFTLEIRPIEILWRQEKSVLVASGLDIGDKVIVSPISAPVEGMALRLPGVTRKQVTPKNKQSEVKGKASASKTSAESASEKGQTL